jgi:exonuclease VII large subunit
MDILKKIETLINASARSKLPRRKRRGVLDEQEEKLLAEIRHAVAQVQAQEQLLAARLKAEHVHVDEAAQQGDTAAQRVHQRRASELERQLRDESIQAINLEEKLASLEEKLALAKEAVDKQAKAAAFREEEADRAMAVGSSAPAAAVADTGATQPDPAPAGDDAPDLSARKSRLSGE